MRWVLLPPGAAQRSRILIGFSVKEFRIGLKISRNIEDASWT